MQKPIGPVALVREISQELVHSIRQSGLRPGIKVLFYDPFTSEVLLGTLPSGYPLRFNLPGGGIDEGQSSAEALCREIEEELGIYTYTPGSVGELAVIAQGELPFEREGFRGKYEFIAALPRTLLDSIRALPDSKMLFWPVMHCDEALEKVLILGYGGLEMTSLYVQALENISALTRR